MNLIFRSRAVKRMFERNVMPEDVRQVLAMGKRFGNILMTLPTQLV